MNIARLVLSEQPRPWKLHIEPWMLEFRVPKEQPVRIVGEGLQALEEVEFEVLVSGHDVVVWTYLHTFKVILGSDIQQFDFSAVADGLNSKR